MNAVLAAIALLVLGSAAAALALRNLIHSALLLILSWLGIALFFLWADAEFAAFAQVLVYVGAVSMVVLFAVLLTRQSRADLSVTAQSRGRAAAGVGAALAVAAVLAFSVLRTPLPVPSGLRSAVTVRQLGGELMGPHAGALLLVGVLLTVTLLGAVTIAGAGRLPPDGKDQP